MPVEVSAVDPTRSEALLRTATVLLDAGADPNDDEAVYHSPETDDNAAMAALVETGRVTWTHRRTPESVEALLRAGASVRGAGVRFASGYAEVDDLLRRFGA